MPPPENPLEHWHPRSVELSNQPCGDLWLDFPGHETVTDYRRFLDVDADIALSGRVKDGAIH